MTAIRRFLIVIFISWSVVFCSSPVPAQGLPSRIVTSQGMEFVLVPAGRHLVCHGPETDETGPGFVDLDAFYIQTTEATRTQWAGLGVDDRFGRIKEEESSLPAHGLSHGDALNLAARLNRTVGRNIYSLPKEAQWEAACRAGGEGFAMAPDELEAAAWVRANSQGRPHAVAGKSPNKLGLYDMLGNLYEWCQESYSPRSCPGPAEGDPNGPTRGLYRVLRGGSYNSTPDTARCGWRFFYQPTLRHPEHGCRLVRTAIPLLDGEK